MKKNLFLFILLITSALYSFSQPIYNKDGIRLHHSISAEEREWGKTQAPILTAPTAAPEGELRPIAEYEPAEAVLVSYTIGAYANGFGIPTTLIKEMAEDCRVIILVVSSLETTVRNILTNAEVNLNNCEFVHATTDSYWTRDYGPWFMAIDNQEVAMYDFTYNRPRYNDNNINSTLAPYLDLERYASNIQHCGGNFMNDGTNQAASTDLALEENTNYTEAQLKQHFLEYLGVEEYHFLEDPLQDYIKHIDCWGKYLAPNKVMVGQVPESDNRYALYEAAANYFASLTSPWGTPMQVYRVLSPGGTEYSSYALNTTPYTNSLILNKKVFVPITGSSHDAAAIQSYKDAMPGYEIIGIEHAYNSTYTYWFDTDALHCRTHEIADRCMLYVKHMPIHGEIENIGGEMTFVTELYSYCDNEIYTDSVFVFLRVNGGEYEAYNMEYVSDNKWEVTVGCLPDGDIEYYVSAVDVSGRKENHPYIGAPDPHKFTLINGSEFKPILDLDKTESAIVSTELTVVEDHIVVSNLCNADLTFDITNIDFDNLLEISPMSGTINPWESQTITLSYDFTDSSNGVYTGSFILETNDMDNLETVINLTASLNHIGIDNINSSEIKIYPNPASDMLNVDCDVISSTKMQIYNILGKQLTEVELIKGVNNVDIQYLPAGVYFIKINAETFKFIKQ